MPYSNDAKWILEEGNYYLKEYNIDYFSLWKRVVKMQVELLDITNVNDFRLQWNEIQRLRKQMRPLLSKDGTTLFTLSNAFDNIENLGLSYIKNQRKTLPSIIFLVEIMNALMSMTDDPYYTLNDDLHIYYDSFNENYSYGIAVNTNYNFADVGSINSNFLNRKYYNPKLPIHLFFDWGGTISFCLAAQFSKTDNTLYIIKEFYELPGHGDMSKNLMKQVVLFFESHFTKRIIFVRDSYGDNSSHSIQSSKTINESAISKLRSSKWNVAIERHKYKEPPYFEKWQVMQKVMNVKDNTCFNLKIDGNNCKYLLIAMRITKSKQVGNEFKKDKRLERKTGADQREATHSTDALDKGCYWLHSNIKKTSFRDIYLSK